MGADMIRLPCRYAVVQFLPFTETGEFANIGVVLACPATGYVGFKLQTRRWGRITAFFDEISATTYRRAVRAFGMELERVRLAAANLPDDGRRPVAMRQLFEDLVHPREALMRFGQPRAVLAEAPARMVDTLFEHYVERSFATPEYVEHAITQRVQALLRSAPVVAPFKAERIGNDEVHARFPFVQTLGGQFSKVIKPFNLSQAEPNDIFDHGDAWINKMKRLHQRKLLPRAVLFAVKAPPQTDSARFSAYAEVCQELRAGAVTVVDQAADAQILEFATAG